MPFFTVHLTPFLHKPCFEVKKFLYSVKFFITAWSYNHVEQWNKKIIAVLLWQNVCLQPTITKDVFTMDHVHSTTNEYQKGNIFLATKEFWFSSIWKRTSSLTKSSKKSTALWTLSAMRSAKVTEALSPCIVKAYSVLQGKNQSSCIQETSPHLWQTHEHPWKNTFSWLSCRHRNVM